MTQRVFIDLGKNKEEEVAELMYFGKITKREFLAKWGFGDDEKLNKEFLNDLIEVIRAEIVNPSPEILTMKVENVENTTTT